MALADLLGKISNSTIKRSGSLIVVTRPNPRPAVKRKLWCTVQRLPSSEIETLRLQGTINMAAPLPFNFVFKRDADVQAGDELPFNGSTYTLTAGSPLPFAGSSLYKVIRGIVAE